MNWVDPNHDGDFSDGVDGFRLDHMMDDLDNKHISTKLFDDFWKLLFAKLRSANPRLKFIAEQWDCGQRRRGFPASWAGSMRPSPSR